ncbi:hypothetical protein GQ600_2653 [Phytophthora cactorum]|nr:hypothetical protein GQ600_2653 [Phytophthora cactorum]
MEYLRAGVDATSRNANVAAAQARLELCLVCRRIGLSRPIQQTRKPKTNCVAPLPLDKRLALLVDVHSYLVVISVR